MAKKTDIGGGMKPQHVLPALHPNSMMNEDIVISVIGGKPLSAFSDSIWDLSPYISNRNCKRADTQIDFRIELSNKVKFTDPALSSFLLSTKGFLYARMSRPYPRSGKTASPRTVVGIWYRLCVLIRWMLDNNISGFGELSVSQIARYRSYVTEKGYSENTINKQLSIVEMLYTFAEFYPESLKVHPWPSETSVAISGDRNKGKQRLSGQTESIPLKVFSIMGKAALDMVENKSERIIATHKACIEVLENYRAKSIQKIDAGLRTYVSEREFQIHYCSTKSMRRRLDSIITRNNFSSYDEHTSAVKSLHTACYIVCGIFSGMRDSELASLDLNAFKKEVGLDNVEYCWLYGRTYKLEENYKSTRWMVPSCVGKAADVLKTITAYDRANLQHQLLYYKNNNSTEKYQYAIQELQRHSQSLFLIKGNRGLPFRNIDNITINNRLKMFIQSNCIHDEHGEFWPISTHQFRRTFAVFVAKNLMGDLRYLRHHFKHWSIDMTLHYAKLEDADESLISEVMTERDQLNRIIVSDWLSEDTPLAGGRGEAIAKFRKRNGVKTAETFSDATKQLADGIFIRSTGHSWCLSNVESCGGEGLYDSLQCTSCDNAVIDKTLVSAWKGIKSQQEEVLTLDDVGYPVKHHAKEQIKAANDIIARLTGES